MQPGTTLVTGATGFAGSHLLDKLADHAPVIAWHRPKGQPPDPNRHLDWRAVDLLDAAEVGRAIDDASPVQVFHIAGAPQVASSFRSSVEHLETNVLGTHNLLDAIRRAGRPCRVLVVSSALVYQASDEPIDENAPMIPATPYGFSKLGQDRLAERAWREDGLDIVIARPFNHAGPRQTTDYVTSAFARQIAEIERGLAPAVLRVGNLESRRDITDVRDTVRAYRLLVRHGQPGRPYNVCSGVAHRVQDLLDALMRLSTASIRVEVDADRLRPSDNPIMMGDRSRIAAETGWEPAISIDRTLGDLLDYWRARISEPS